MEEIRDRYEIEYKIADLIKMRLYQRCHGLAVVLGKWVIQIGDWKGLYWTEGNSLYLDSSRLREEFLEDSQWLCLEFLHMISHWLLGHPFLSGEDKNGKLLDLTWDVPAWDLTKLLWREEIFIKDVYVDSHEYWNRLDHSVRLAKVSGELGGGFSKDGSESEETKAHSQRWWRLQHEKLSREYLPGKKRQRGTAHRKRPHRLILASGHRGDYREILRSFSSFREDSRINQEEFQYAWYEYGMQIYGNMPLIEPLEYREYQKIEDLVLVIDTSASCEKDLVRIFLEETKGILEQDSLFFRHFCLHMLQCDNQIQRDDKITSSEEFEKYLEEFTITGGGGTDFRPAFCKIAELKKAGEFHDLKGILYFTDGCGIYPKEAPDYEVYFVMVKGHYDAIDMPGWIHSLVLEEI
ncbi:MAG: hypothetical protein HFJ10_06375 [Lachnospiraceae bacterium]|jgi:hypothetical protein|nr:hypothetical protein [Lachnospiraceae bacterium]